MTVYKEIIIKKLNFALDKKVELSFLLYILKIKLYYNLTK